MMLSPCHRCGATGAPRLEWRPTGRGRAHLGAYCGACGAWLKWVPQTTEVLREVPPRPEPGTRPLARNIDHRVGAQRQGQLFGGGDCG
jgi:hypothetical protein